MKLHMFSESTNSFTHKNYILESKVPKESILIVSFKPSTTQNEDGII